MHPPQTVRVKRRVTYPSRAAPPAPWAVAKPRNVALIRVLYEDARKRHTERTAYQARQDGCADFDAGTVFREVLHDVLAAVRGVCRGCRMGQSLAEHAKQKAQLRNRAFRIRVKIMALATWLAILKDRRDNPRPPPMPQLDPVDQQWQSLMDSVAASVSLASRSARALCSGGLCSWRLRRPGSGKIAEGLRSPRFLQPPHEAPAWATFGDAGCSNDPCQELHEQLLPAPGEPEQESVKAKGKRTALRRRSVFSLPPVIADHLPRRRRATCTSALPHQQVQRGAGPVHRASAERRGHRGHHRGGSRDAIGHVNSV